MLDKFEEIESCGYECEAGKLELNVTYQELKLYVKKQEKDIEDLFESLQIANISRKSLVAYIDQLREELIEAYQKRGHMYSAGEKDWIDNRLKELKDEIDD